MALDLAPDELLNFAYGSNLAIRYVHDECPSARTVMHAALPNYSIAFRRYSTNMKGGISTIIETPGGLVHGALYAIKRAEIEAMDELGKRQRGTLPARNLPRAGCRSGMAQRRPLPRGATGRALPAITGLSGPDDRGSHRAWPARRLCRRTQGTQSLTMLPSTSSGHWGGPVTSSPARSSAAAISSSVRPLRRSATSWCERMSSRPGPVFANAARAQA